MKRTAKKKSAFSSFAKFRQTKLQEFYDKTYYVPVTEKEISRWPYVDKNDDWIDLDPSVERPFKKARYLKVPLTENGYVNTAVLDLLEIISQELPH